jgi:hypothetical protein
MVMWNKITTFFEAAGRVRTAAELARQGRHDLARKIILGEELSR